MTNDTRQLVQPMHSECKDCNTACATYAKEHDARKVAPIFDDMRVANALSIPCVKHYELYEAKANLSAMLTDPHPDISTRTAMKKLRQRIQELEGA